MRLSKILTLIVLAFIFLHLGQFYLYCQEKQDTREQARQHYLQGKELYSQGRYQEAASEFEQASKLLNKAKIEYMEKIQQEQQKALMPPSPQAEPLPKKELTEKKIEEEEAEVAETISVPAPAPETEEIGEEEYYIDIGDVLDISVWQVPDLSRQEVIVRPDGKLSFHLIGDIKAKGLTLTQLDTIITEKLKAYIINPEVSVMIRRFGEGERKEAKKVVILGEIPGPGVYKFSSDPTITELIASAGGYTKYAVLNSIMIIRGDVVKAKPEVIRVNFASILKSGNLSENIFLKPNDIVYVPRSFIGNVNTFLEIIQPAIGEYLQTLNARHLHNTVHRKGGI